MKVSTVSELLTQETTLVDVEVKGWVRTFRANRFIALNDGSTINNIQCVVDFENTNEETLRRITTGAAVHIKGQLVESQGRGQRVEVQVNTIVILGDSDPEERARRSIYIHDIHAHAIARDNLAFLHSRDRIAADPGVLIDHCSTARCCLEEISLSLCLQRDNLCACRFKDLPL